VGRLRVEEAKRRKEKRRNTHIDRLLHWCIQGLARGPARAAEVVVERVQHSVPALVRVTRIGQRVELRVGHAVRGGRRGVVSGDERCRHVFGRVYVCWSGVGSCWGACCGGGGGICWARDGVGVARCLGVRGIGGAAIQTGFFSEG
jgi:hypothetical protein